MFGVVDQASAIPANRLSWVTASSSGSSDDARTQETVDLDTADESVRRWRLGRSLDAVADDAPQGPVSPDGYQRLGVGTSGYFEGGLVMGDATGVQPLSGSVRFSDPVQGPNWELAPTLFSSTAWHPSGQRVYAEAATTSAPGDPAGYLEPKIVRFDIDGHTYTPLIDFPDAGDSHFGQRDPDVDAGNERLAFVTEVDPDGEPTGQTLELYGWSFRPQALYVAGTDGSDPTPLVTGDHWLRIADPAIAPDGSAVVFVGLTDTFAYGLFKVSTATGVVTQLTDAYADPGYSTGTPDWSPDGAHIAYLRTTSMGDPQTYPAKVMVMDPDGDHKRTLATAPEGGEVTGLSFRQASSYPDPGPGPFPVISTPPPPPPSGPATWGAGSAGIPGVPGGVSPQMPSCNRGRPVNCATGNQWEQLADLTLDGVGGPTVLSRTYNSQAAAANQTGRLGRGWSRAFGARLDQPGDPHRATVTLDDARQVSFMEMPDGGWQAAAWVQATLTRREDGGFRLRLPSRYRLDFDASGRLESEEDRNGNLTTLEYADGHLTTITAPSGRSMALHYNADDTVSEAVGPGGHTVSYEYAGGKLVAVENVDGGRWEYGYDWQGQLTSMTDPRGHVTTTSYDNQNRVVEQTDAGQTTQWAWSPGPGDDVEVDITGPTGRHTVEHFRHGLPTTITRAAGSAAEATESFAYNGQGDVASRTDAAGMLWTYGYDQDGNRVSASDPEDHARTWEYDADRNVLRAQLPSGRRTVFEYDSHGNATATATTNPAGTAQSMRTESTYTPRGELATSTDALNRTTHYTYDTAGDLTVVLTPSGREISRTYDVNGWVLSRTAPKGNVAGANAEAHTTHYVRNAFGDTTQVTDAENNVTSLEYDHNRNLVTVIDPDDKQLSSTFDAHDRPIAAHYPDGTSTTSTLDAAGRLTARTNRAGKQTTYRLDALSRVTQTTDPLDRHTSYSYDDGGRLTSTTKPNGKTIHYAYDDAGALTDVLYPDSDPQDVHLTYDQDGRKTQVIDETGTTTFAYDPFGRIEWVTDGGGAHVGYGYDDAGQMTSIDYPVAPGQAAKTLTRAFSADGELESVTDWNGRQTTFSYDADGGYAGASYAESGIADEITRDATGAITDMKVADGTDELAAFAYTRDALGRVAGSTASGLPGDGTRSCARDSADRLTGAGGQTYEYTAAGDITKLDSGDNASYDDGGQLSTLDVDGGTQEFGYDAEGDRIASKPLNGPTTTYQYDVIGQLRAVHPGRVAPQLAAGERHTLIVDSAGQGSSWGWGDFGQLGDGSTGTSDAPVQITGIDHLAQLSAGDKHSLAVDADGRLFSWGDNAHGQLGDPAANSGRATPGRVPGLSSASQVAAGDRHSLALESGGTVYAWGANDHGQLGDATAAVETVAPQLVPGVSAVEQVAAGADFSLALKTDGTVWGWGATDAQQLGAATGPTAPPAAISGLSDIARIAAGEQFAVALDHDGHVWTWGPNDHGQRGSATTATAPAMLASLSGIVAVAAGADHALALASDGTVYSWGSNQDGQLGNGTSGTDTAIPTMIADLDDVARIAAGNHTSFAVHTDGSMSAWGRNDNGQLATGTASNQTTPTTISAPSLQLPETDEHYAYDYAGLRATRTQAQQTERYVWDTRSSGLPLLLADGEHRYIYGPNGLAVAQIAQDGTTTYLHQDQLGSTRLLTNADGDVTATATYSSYGRPQALTGPQSKLGYAGAYTDTLTGFHYNRARYHDPVTAQFLTRDPAEDTTGQPYAYADNDPLSYIDPTGQIGIPSLEDVSNFAAGFGDTVSLGATQAIRQALGVDNVDYCSGAYGDGGYAGVATGMALGGAGIIRGAGAAATAAADDVSSVAQVIKTRPGAGSDGGISTHVIEQQGERRYR
jgi:RHS repeat-associated protein